ncbi:hypothetical protein [Natrinema limicola]|nr:hypothetical protein [Natrinema limicola]
MTTSSHDSLSGTFVVFGVTTHPVPGDDLRRPLEEHIICHPT